MKKYIISILVIPSFVLLQAQEIAVTNTTNLPEKTDSIVMESINLKVSTLETNIETLSTTIVDSTNTVNEDDAYDFGEIIVSAPKNKNSIESIDRLPIKNQDRPQTVTVVDEETIKDQGALTVTQVTQNVAGVSQFGTYGGVKESMSTRGYRGVPVLKNGISIDSDFRTAGMITDMQGISSIQVLKGSAAISQGLGNGLGSAGGVINVTTKTPEFINTTEVGIRAGSWGLIRPFFDYQQNLGKDNKTAFRLNGAFERADGFRKYVGSDKVYINPSFEWRPDDKTSVILEMDYLNQNKTPDRGTVNLASDDSYALYEMPHNKFLGFDTDNNNEKVLTYSARFNRKINDKLSFRAAYVGAIDETNTMGVGALKKVGDDYNIRTRTLTKTEGSDKNSVLQLDLIGKDINTGKIKHTFQTGMDFKFNKTKSINYDAIDVDKINIFEDFTNTLPSNIADQKMNALSPVETSSNSYGITIQDMITFNPYIKTLVGLRYSNSTSQNNTSTGKTTGNALDPMASIIISPTDHFKIFGSFATTTSTRSASTPLEGGGTAGNAVSRQWEFGIKSELFKNRLIANLTYFNIVNDNLTYSIYDENGVTTGYSGLAGDLKRQGIEFELIGKITPNIEIMAGYAYLDAKYKDSPAYVDGSEPMNAPKNTANAWLKYGFDKGKLNGLYLGAGIYHVGSRPVNEYSMKNNGHGTIPGIKPFDMPAYTTVNAQIGYEYGDFNFKVFANNIFNELGYTSYYRGGYINQIDPRNFSAQITYNFK